MFYKQSSLGQELEIALSQQLSPTSQSPEELQVGQCLEQIDQVTAQLEQLGFQQVAEILTQAIEKLAENPTGGETGSLFSRSMETLQKLKAELMAADWSGHKGADFKKYYEKYVLRGLDMSLIGLSLLEKIKQKNLGTLPEQQPEEDPLTIREAVEIWHEEINKIAKKKKKKETPKAKKKNKSGPSKKKEVAKVQIFVPPSSKKQVENLKEVGWPFDAPKDKEYSSDCSMSDDCQCAECSDVDSNMNAWDQMEATPSPYEADDYSWLDDENWAANGPWDFGTT